MNPLLTISVLLLAHPLNQTKKNRDSHHPSHHSNHSRMRMLILWSAKFACSTPQNGGQQIVVLRQQIVVQRHKIVFLRFFYGLSTLALFLDLCGNWIGKKQHTITCSCHLHKLQRTILLFARMKALPTQRFQQVVAQTQKGPEDPIKK